MLHLRVFTRNNQQFQAIHGDIYATVLNFGDERINEWNLCQMKHILHSMDLSMEVSETELLVNGNAHGHLLMRTTDT